MSTKHVVIGVAVVIVAAAGWYLGSPLFFDTVVDERFPVVAMPEAERRDETNTAEPQSNIEASGTFRDADSFHQGSGRATIYALPDGKRVLRFEDFTVTNGPALSVYLVRGVDGDVDSGYLDLGKLKGNKGSQNYDIPEGTDLDLYRSVVIWCVPFGVTFATASLQ